MDPELRAAYIAARQKEAGSAYAYAALADSAESRLAAQNAAHGFTAELSAGGVRIVRPTGTVTMRLAAWGCPGAMAPAESRRPRLAAASSPARAEYHGAHADEPLTEWYQNGPLGLEQGFTLASRPACADEANDKLEFAVSLEGAASLRQRGERSGEAPAIEMSLGADQGKLVYSDLFAADATGRPLSAKMRLSGEQVVLTVDAKEARYPLTIDPLVWLDEARLTASDATGGDRFGTSVSIFGNTAVVGAPENDPAGKTSAGAAYVFVRSGRTWAQQAKLTASDSVSYGRFGIAVAIYDNTIAVAAVQSAGSTGALYVFVRSGSYWSQQARLARTSSLFSPSVAIYKDTVALGDPGATPGGVSTGAVYVYTRPAGGSSWTQQAELSALDRAGGDNLGESVALFADTVLAGARWADPGGLTSAGAAYVFTRPAGGTAWTQQAKLVASDMAASDFFATAVALYEDTAVIGSPSADPGGLTSAGAAYVFTRPAGGTVWTEQTKLTASDAATNDSFGSAVAVGKDRALVAGRSASSRGVIYVFDRPAGGTFTESAKFVSSSPGADYYFGNAVALSSELAIVGAIYADGGGSATVFRVGKANGDACMTASECASDACVGGTCGKADGDPCTAQNECKSGFCTDGVCCDSACSGGSSDCQACSKAAGSSTDGKCELRASGASCRSANASQCIAGGTCNGTTAVCNLQPAANTVICYGTASPTMCVLNYRCDGVTVGSCPSTNPTPSSRGTRCSSSFDNLKCIDGYGCDGTTAGTCPRTNPIPAYSGQPCSNGDPSRCVFEYRCDGVTTGSCPKTNPRPEARGVVCNSFPDPSKCIANLMCDGTTAGSCPTTNPTPLGSTTVCNSTGDRSKCVASYRCNGSTTGSCPTTNPVLLASGTSCASPDNSICSAGGTCDGFSARCNLSPASSSVVCASTPDPASCRANYRCSGFSFGSCPTSYPTPAASGTLCRDATLECDTAEFCNGTTAACPSDAPKPNSTSCSVGTCQSGACRPESELSVQLVAAPESTIRQEPVTLRVRIANSGKVAASQVRLDLELPAAAGFAVSQISAGSWTCQSAGSMASCTISEIVPGTTSDITLTMVPPLSQPSFTIKASLSSATYDANLLNNSAQVSVNNASPCSTACSNNNGGGGGSGGGGGTGGGAQSSGCQASGQATAPPGSFAAVAVLLSALCLALRRRSRRERS